MKIKLEIEVDLYHEEQLPALLNKEIEEQLNRNFCEDGRYPFMHEMFSKALGEMLTRAIEKTLCQHADSAEHYKELRKLLKKLRIKCFPNLEKLKFEI